MITEGIVLNRPTKGIGSYSKTTNETSAQRIHELTKLISYSGGIAGTGARALAMLFATLEVRITDLEAQVEALARKGRK